MNVKLKEVKTKTDLKKFIKYPLVLYKNHPFYVPAVWADEMNTLAWDRNPAFDHCEARYWLAYDQKQIVGRVAAIINRKHIEKWQQPYMRFGWLDFNEDDRVSHALLTAVETWAIEQGLQAVHGPLGFSDLDREGMLIEGFNELGTLATQYITPTIQNTW